MEKADASPSATPQPVITQQLPARAQPISHQNAPNSSSKRKHRWLLLVTSLLLIIPISFAAFTVITNSPLLKKTPSPTSTQVVMFSPGGTLRLNDPLKDNNMGHGWNETTDRCEFKGGAYHVTAVKPVGYECNTDSPNTDFSNFAYQVTMAIMQGSEGGICFRFTISNQSGDCFIVNLNRHYVLETIHYDNQHTLASGQSNYFLTGLGKINQIAVRAQGNTIGLYINGHFIQSATDNSFSHGQIGLIIDYLGVFTDVAFIDAKVWVY